MTQGTSDKILKMYFLFHWKIKSLKCIHLE